MKKVLLLDVDEVITFSGILDAVNEYLNTNYSIDDFTDYYIDEVAIPKDKFDDYNNFLKNRDFYKTPTLLPNAIEVIKKLNEVYDVYICSSCINPLDIKNSGFIFRDKYNFLLKTLPFIDPKHFIFTSSKHLIKADIQIDDLVSNLKNETELRILFPSYHNKDITNEELESLGIVRIGYDWRTGWDEVEKLLLNKN